MFQNYQSPLRDFGDYDFTGPQNEKKKKKGDYFSAQRNPNSF